MTDEVLAISAGDIEFHPCSFADSAGRLFRADGRLYRGLAEPSVAFYEQLFHTGVIDDLVGRGLLVESQLTQYSAEGYPRVVEHRELPFVSYVHEWSPEMLRSAARHVLELSLQLSRRGLQLKDAHTWNVLFDGPLPRWVDLGSIESSRGQRTWIASREFRDYFLNPLLLISFGAEDIARTLLGRCYDEGITGACLAHFSRTHKLRSDLSRVGKKVRTLAKRLIPSAAREMLLAKRHDYYSSHGSQSEEAQLHRLREELDSIPLRQSTSAWSQYHDDYPRSFEPAHDPSWDAKQTSIFKVLTKHTPATVLDVGSNRGWFAHLAAKNGATVVAIDNDGPCIDRLYSDAIVNALPILPLIVDVRLQNLLCVCGKMLAPAWERLQCDLVLALALVHHLTLRNRHTFEQVVTALRRFTRRHLLVEFPTPADHWVKQMMRADDGWYTSEEFQSTLERHFSTVERLPSYPETRDLYLCTV